MDAAIQFNDKPGMIAIKISHIIKTILAGFLVNDQVLPEKPESEQFLAIKVLLNGKTFKKVL